MKLTEAQTINYIVQEIINYAETGLTPFFRFIYVYIYIYIKNHWIL